MSKNNDTEGMTPELERLRTLAKAVAGSCSAVARSAADYNANPSEKADKYWQYRVAWMVQRERELLALLQEREQNRAREQSDAATE